MPGNISEERKMAYYVGMGLQILGGLLFASTFVTSLMHFGDFTDFESRAKSSGFPAFGGMALLIVGGIVRGIGARGLAGSGVILDPEKARDELEPFSRMAGGMVRDAIDEARIGLGGESSRVIMVRCRSCAGLNQESAKFCQECGQKL
ncbi:MAG: hypothetical protein WCK86_13075 [Planctomycetia bacterium]